MTIAQVILIIITLASSGWCAMMSAKHYRGWGDAVAAISVICVTVVSLALCLWIADSKQEIKPKVEKIIRYEQIIIPAIKGDTLYRKIE